MKSRDIVSLAAYGVLSFAILFTTGGQLYVLKPWTHVAVAWMFFLWGLVWSILSYGMLMNHVRCLRKQNARVNGLVVLLTAGSLIAAAGVWAYVDALFLDHGCGCDNGVFSVLPLIQNIAALIAIASANSAGGVSKRKKKPKIQPGPSACDSGSAAQASAGAGQEDACD